MDKATGMVLCLDLSRRKAELRALPPSYLRDYLGGVGLAARLLFDYCPAGADPLGPENPLIFAASALAGTMVPTANKHAVAARSPLTGFIGDSLSSGAWSLALRRAGPDALVITGAAAELTYLFIDNGTAHFRDARHLAGKGSAETEEAIRREIGDERVRVATIGPGGENLVRYACIGNDVNRQAGRTGMGAVMGAKRLKAVVVRGTGAVPVADLAALEKACSALYKKAQTAATEKYRVLGTPANVLAFNRLGALPTRNFQSSTFEGAEAVSGEHLLNYLCKVVACTGCPIACEHVYQAKDGPYAGIKAQVDYETLYALGPMCGVSYAPAIIKAAELCDHYGIDSISGGVSISWAMECFEKGLLTSKDTEGLELRFGNHEALLKAIEMIGLRRGLGDLLAEGVKRASAKLGKGSEHWAMHAKGLELPGYEPRSLKTQGLGFAVGTRGGCHNRSPAYEVDMSGKVDRFKGERGRGQPTMEQEDFAATIDSLTLCKFLRRCFNDFYAETAQLYTMVTGLQMTPEELKRAGERISNLKKAFNIREGWSRADDTLPPRVLHDPLPDGAGRGSVLSQDELNLMVGDYYEARGWTRDGLIPREKLQKLGLEDVAPQIGAPNAAKIRGL